ncbi:MAG TPA: deoxyribodipyrimidine photo-lyase [Edaphocola sp.]|nr:deoxyribodipyrimidine photo-lyase [Edaphocola sp.]
MKIKLVIFWFRRDLRLEDNIGLFKALSSQFPVLPIFIFDKNILDRLENKWDRRVDYIHQSLSYLNNQLKIQNSSLVSFYGDPLAVFKTLSEKYSIQEVFCNRDYEPQAIKRDTIIYEFFNSKGISFKALKDQVIFDKNDILKKDETPYTVFTPYSKRWKEKLASESIFSYDFKNDNFFKLPFSELLTLADIGFEKTEFKFVEPTLDASIIDDYDQFRDFPALEKTTQLGTALRFGTISIRKCVAYALNHNQTWLSELIWREFFMQILYHFPEVVKQPFKFKYSFIKWRNDEAEFELWCKGKTGYPLVDAGMRQLNATGFMHNRVRMVVASFLCKHLLIDWSWGEAYFAEHLNDYDLSANNGNWQWAAGSGCDAAPYFRVFNPIIQLEKFDKGLEYIKKWLPDFGTEDYPKPIVDHVFARERALKAYAEALNEIR